MKKYEEGYKLKDNEYLLKLRANGEKVATGFMTKLNKNGTIPKSLESWGNSWDSDENPDIFIIEETFRSGWKLNGWRFGMSRNWAELIHPMGFTVEIYLSNFLEIVENNIIEYGDIVGEFKWEYSNLVKNV
jgi:hypothetical protein